MTRHATTDQIRALQDEASACSDTRLTEVCRLALEGDDDAIAECGRCIDVIAELAEGRK